MRLDNFLVEKGYFDSRTKAKQSIDRGEIYLDNTLVTKASFEVKNSDINVNIKATESFVSLGGYKLKKAIEDFNFSVNDLICADIGASTGGFTDCLIKRGAKKVYSVDLNDSLLHYSLKENDKVFSIIKNVKNLNQVDFEDKLDLIVADLSFISITQAIPIFAKLLDENKSLIVLIKPQFETGERKKFKNGIIRDKKIQLEACLKAYDCAVENSLCPINFTLAPLSEDKNIEFLMHFVKGANVFLDKNKIKF